MDMEHKPAPHPSDDALAKAFADACRGSPDGAHLAGLRAVADLVAQELAKGQEPDCFAVLTPNGSRLVSPQEAKGNKKSYPLYARPFVAAPAGVPDVSVDTNEKLRALMQRLGLTTEESLDAFNASLEDNILRTIAAANQLLNRATAPAGVPEGWIKTIGEAARLLQAWIDEEGGCDCEGTCHCGLPALRTCIAEIRAMLSAAPAAPAAGGEPKIFAANEIVAAEWGVDPMTPFVRLVDKATWDAMLDASRPARADAVAKDAGLLREQFNRLLSAAMVAAKQIRRCDYTPARSTLLNAIAEAEALHG